MSLSKDDKSLDRLPLNSSRHIQSGAPSPLPWCTYVSHDSLISCPPPHNLLLFLPSVHDIFHDDLLPYLSRRVSEADASVIRVLILEHFTKNGYLILFTACMGAQACCWRSSGSCLSVTLSGRGQQELRLFASRFGG